MYWNLAALHHKQSFMKVNLNRHSSLKCYVLIDLKVGKLVHQDIGQMQMYVNFYDRQLKQPDDNPTVGLILCEDKKDAVVRYTLTQGNKQIFASRYKLYLPTEDELIKELKRERILLKSNFDSH